MAGSPDLFVVCKKCGNEVSPYITECPYCGTRLRKRAPKIERPGELPEPPKPTRKQRRVKPPREVRVPGVGSDPTGRPVATIALVALSLVGFLVLAFVPEGDVALLALSDEQWRIAASLFAYGNGWYQLAVLVAVGLAGWRLELRHGPVVVLLLFFACGAGGNALAAQVEASPFILGAPGAALGMLAAWALPDVLRARRGEDHDADLIGALVLGLLVAAMPLAVSECSAIATYSGLALGLLAGWPLSRTEAAR